MPTFGKRGPTNTEGNTSSIMDSVGLPKLPAGMAGVMGNEKNEQKLLKFIKERLIAGDDTRERMIDRLWDVDVQTSGFVALDEDDRKRDRDNRRGKVPKPVKHNLPLAASQLEEACTYLMSVFAPNGDIFEAIAPADKQELAKGMAKHVNQQGQKAGYYSEFSRFTTNAMKYNIAAMTVRWENQTGVVWGNSAGGQAKAKDGVVWSGNRLENIDMYNFMWDTTVHPVDLPRKGEFFATVDMITPFRARKMEKDKILFWVDRYIDRTNTDGSRWYREKPDLRYRSDRDADTEARPGRGGTNWMNVLSAGAIKEVTPGIEIVDYYGWICPKDYAISEETGLQLYWIKMANGMYITSIAKLDDSAGILPLGVSCPIIDDMNNDQRTYAEQLIPLQHFASFLLNTHQDATRKKLYGITIYNQNAFPGMDKSLEDLVSAIIPMRSTGQNQDIDKVFRQYNDAPQTEGCLRDIGVINDLMQKILPTDMLQQVADLDRATLYQAAATVQAGNRRSLKIARMIATQALSEIKFLMIYNIYANQEPIDVVMDDGKRLQIAPAEIRELQVELEIAGGVKGLDRLMNAQIIKEIINMTLQSQQAMSEIDVVKLIDYYTTMTGDTTDFNQFRRTQAAPAIAAQAPEGANPTIPAAQAA